MDAIIGLIFISLLLMKIIESDKEKKKDSLNKQSAKKQQPNQAVYRAGSQRDASGWGAGNPYDSLQQQRATKERLKRKYGSWISANQTEKADVFTRAKANVQEETEDRIKQELHAAVCSEYRSHAQTQPDLAAHRMHAEEWEAAEESDIIKHVNDLIVTGYSGEMEFDRDFVAEGIEMLNSYNL